MKKIPLIVITGPTASGKTDLAIQTAKRLNGEIISADSMQIYRYMNIGTAKPTIEERQGIPHHMIDIIDPDEEYNVALFQKHANVLIREIAGRGRLPILAGGSGLYVNSIIYPMNFTDAVDDPAYRSNLKKILEENGVIYLHNLLKQVDPDTAFKLHPNDTRRIIRALEVYHLTGKTMKEYRQNYREMEPQYNLLLYGLTMDRQTLYRRINQRVDKMINAGLVREVISLLDRGYGKDLVSMQGLGYKEIVSYLEGLVTLEEAIEILKRDTRRFAKRQLTWFKREDRILWLDRYAFDDLSALAEWMVLDVEKKLLSNW
ncbi:MAG: tRNA (adenosine(37)-N6)-dimethylallyltransferase MiaA [Caldicoprobacterales bacterium]|jgi:tRNA dimethylallyltransferase|nr:tRNA (adenosine(37)-N6)-dimethylallyltransferase MiaA [Clostridiales bacterium]